VVYPYSGKYRKLLGEYKFGRNGALGVYLAERLREACARLPVSGSGIATTVATTMATTAARDTGQSIRGVPVLVPVPPRPGKLRKTGWDQVEYLARLLKREGLPVYPCLRRLPSLSQKKLSREDRLRNLRNRFVLTRPAPPLAVLFDDVITTGATIEACAGALKDAGTEKVYGVCLFYD
jgi:predicted amidophosphoribosyltransferase